MIRQEGTARSFLRNVTALDLYLRSDKDKVDFLAGVGNDAAEIVEGIAGTGRLCGFLVASFSTNSLVVMVW